MNNEEFENRMDEMAKKAGNFMEELGEALIEECRNLMTFRRRFEYVDRIVEKDFELPKRSTKYSMAYDIYSPENFELKPGETYMLKTGINVCMGKNEGLILNVRSSMGKKHIMLGNTNRMDR